MERIKNELRAVILHINMELKNTKTGKGKNCKWNRLMRAKGYAEIALKELA